MATSNENEPKATALVVNDLNHKELQAVQMRYLGKPSSEIAEVTGYEESYVRRLFMQGGRLEKAYHEYALQMRGETQAVANGVLERAKTEAKHAIERVIELSKNPFQAATCFKANEYLLSLIGLSQNDPLRAMLKGLGFDDARKKINELFQDIFDTPLDAKMRTIVLMRHGFHCDNCGKDFEDREDTPEEFRKATGERKKTDGTPSNP